MDKLIITGGARLDGEIRISGDDLVWKTSAWNHLACAYIGLDRFDDAVKFAERAVAKNPVPDHAASFAATLERARMKTPPSPIPITSVGRARDPVFGLLDAGDFASAAVLVDMDDAPWRVRRAPARSPWCPGGQQWLRQQRRAAASRPGRVYVLWSAAEWRARSASLPWAPRPRYFVRGPV